MIEYAADILRQPNIAQWLQQLAEQENIAKKLSRPRNDSERREQQQAVEKAKSIRRSLLQHADPTVIYHYLKTTGAAEAVAFRTTWQASAANVDVMSQLPFGKDHPIFTGWMPPTPPDLAEFPVGSFVLNIPFELDKPYMSKNDQDFYIIENPIQREKIFQLPMIRSTSWKGALRGALWQQEHPETDPITIRLFGSPRAEEDDFNAGRLQFYTSFFSQTGLEIINPHDRKKKTGKNLIWFETVKQGARSTFLLFYFPFDRIGENDPETSSQALADLVVVANGLQAMFTTYGFGAKTSSGFGVARDDLPTAGSLTIKRYHAGKAEVFALSDLDTLSTLVRQAGLLERRLKQTQEEQA